jgi:hypothetical protein
MRFHPKRRASTDHEPGPNIARAAPRLASRKYAILSAGVVKNRMTASRATSAAIMGVKNPIISRTPAQTRSTDTIAVRIRGFDNNVEPAL